MKMKTDYKNLQKAWNYFSKLSSKTYENMTLEKADLLNECMQDCLSYEEFKKIERGGDI